MSCFQPCVNALSSGFRFFDNFEQKICGTLKRVLCDKKESITLWFNENGACIVRLQSYPDAVGNAFTSRIVEPLSQWNEEWLEKPIEGSLPFKVIVILVKAPVCAVRNMAMLVYSIVKNILHAMVHPIDALFDFGIFLIDVVHTYAQIENASKTGAAMLGASVGQALIMGNPVSVIAASLGAFVLVLGLSLGPLRAAVLAEEGYRAKAARDNFIEQVEKLPEMFLTGLLMGVFLGGIEKLVWGNGGQSQLSNSGFTLPPPSELGLDLAVAGVGGLGSIATQLDSVEKAKKPSAD